MGVRETAIKQVIAYVNQCAEASRPIKAPKKGWLATFRDAIGISGAGLAHRVGVTRAAIAQAERSERNGAITIKHMERLAHAMGGRFVYAIVPETSIADIIEDQARHKAEAIVKRTSGHMALEQQALSPKQLREEIERLANELVRERPSDFWDEP